MSESQAPAAWSGVLFTLVAAVGFALSLVMARVSYEYGSNAQSVMLVRFVLISLLLLAWARHKRLVLRLPGRQRWACAGCGVLYFSGILAYLSSVAWLPVSLSVLIFYTFPILVALLSALWLRQAPSWLALFALLLAFAGLLLARDVRELSVSPIGLALAATAAVAVALNLLFSAAMLKRVPTLVFSTYTSLACAALALAAVLASGGLQLPSQAPGWAAFALMLASFSVAFVSTYAAIARLGSLRFSSLMNLEPVATIVFAVVLLGELMSGEQVLGAVVVVSGVVLAQLAARRH